MSEMKVVLEVPEEKVGAFLGAKGKNIRFIIGKTKRELNPDRGDGVDLSGLFCQINVDQETKEVSALMKAGSEEHLEVLKKNILFQQDYVLGKVERTPGDDHKNRDQDHKNRDQDHKNRDQDHKNRDQGHKNRKTSQFTTKYVFKTAMEHHMIPKFIGSKGTNIQNIKGRIILSDEHLDGNKININICEDKKIRLQRLHFELLKTDVETPSMVLVSVELNTKNRDETLNVVRDIVKEFVEKASMSYNGGFSHVSSNPPFTKDGGFTPDDSGELDNPF
jgi:hypothetical protein